MRPGRNRHSAGEAKLEEVWRQAEKIEKAARRSKAAGDRRCLLSGETLPKSQLIRFVAGPGGELVPDIEERLPGRGLWLRAERDMIDQACAKKAFSRAARTQLTVPDGLADQVEAMIRRKCLDLLGLARRGGQLAGGAQQVRDMLSGKGAALFLSASDGSADERGKMSALAPGVPVCTRFTSAELGPCHRQGARGPCCRRRGPARGAAGERTQAAGGLVGRKTGREVELKPWPPERRHTDEIRYDDRDPGRENRRRSSAYPGRENWS